MSKPRVLIVDDERNTREGLEKAFRDKYEIHTAENAEKGMRLLQSMSVDVVLTDLRMPGMDGMAFIRWLTNLKQPPLVILFTAYGNLQTAVAAMKEGAYDYLTKPLNLENVEMVIDRGLQSRTSRRDQSRMRKELNKKYGLEGIIGNSAAMHQILETVRRVAAARSTVLLSGESGTGKEIIAQAIHRLSPRADNPFVVVHCASLNPNLLESELFGHEKGAYTGAHERQLGRFELADQGTIFLDEIGEIDASTQIKLLRVLETRNFERVGGNKPIETDARVIAATNRNLKELVRSGKFREDLFYRLNVVDIEVPPLRQRKEDIPLLLNHFLQQSSRENDKTINGFSKEALKMLTAYDWPGNVRELRNCVERMAVMATSNTLTISDIPVDVRAALADSFLTEDRKPPEKSGVDNKSDESNEGENATNAEEKEFNIDHQERRLIAEALAECQGNRTRAAEKLGVSRRTLHRKLKAYGMS